MSKKKEIVDQGGGGIKAPFHTFFQCLGDIDILLKHFIVLVQIFKVIESKTTLNQVPNNEKHIKICMKNNQNLTFMLRNIKKFIKDSK